MSTDSTVKAPAVETWVSVLVYAGLLLACLGWFVARSEPGLGWLLMLGGGGLVAIGVLLFYLRSSLPS